MAEDRTFACLVLLQGSLLWSDGMVVLDTYYLPGHFVSQQRSLLRKPSHVQAFSKLGSYYSRRPDGARNLFADGEELKRGKGTELKWLRTYVAEGGPENFELDGIIWKSSKSEE